MSSPAKSHGFTLLCQSDRAGREERVAHQVALLDDIPLCRAALAELERHSTALASGETVPVGSVEFVRRAMALAGIAEPESLSYPHVLKPYLRRQLERIPAGLVMGHWFVKPTVTKAFTGFVFDTFESPDHLSCHDRAQYDAFMAVDPRSPVWVSETVSWASEVRYYVLDGEILGEGRYDDGPDDVLLPEAAVVQEMVSRFSASPGAPVAFALDAGRLQDGSTALVEVNDMWAVGFYSGTLTEREYVRMLHRRWAQLTGGRRSGAGAGHARA